MKCGGLKSWFFVFFLVIFWCVGDARAAVKCESSPGEEWCPLSAGPVTTWSAPVCSKGEIYIQPIFYGNRTRGSFNDEAHYDALPEGDKKSQYQEYLFIQYGLTDRFEIDGQMVYQQNYARTGGASAHTGGFGDSYLFLRYCMFEEKNLLPHITGVFQVKFPTGQYQKLDADRLETDSMGTGSYDYGAGLIMTKKIRPFVLHADFIYTTTQETKIDGVKTRYGDYLNYDFGAEYFFGKGFNLLVEFNGLIQGDQKTDGDWAPGTDSAYLNVSPGIGWSCDAVQTLIAYQRTLLGTNTDANDSVVATCIISF